MDINYKDFIELQNYIDENEIPFTEWIKNELVSFDFIFKWLDRWDEIPRLAYKSISERKDGHLFYHYSKISENPIEFIHFLKIQLESKYFLKHMSIIKQKLRDKKFRFRFKKFVKKFNSENNLMTLNLFNLLDYLNNTKLYIRKFKSLIVEKMENTNENEKKLMKELVKQTTDYLIKLIENGEYILDGMNVLEEVLLTLLELKIEVSETNIKILKNLFNEKLEQLNLYNKELLIRYLFLFCNHSIEPVLNIFAIEKVYLKTENVDVKMAIMDMILKQLGEDNFTIISEHVIYMFLTELNTLLDNYEKHVNTIFSYSFKEEDSIAEEELELINISNYHIWNTDRYMMLLNNLLNVEKKNISSNLFLSGIRKYLTSITIHHLFNMNKNFSSFILENYHLENFNKVWIDIYKFYANNDEFLEEIIINEMNETHYRYFINEIIDTYSLISYKNINRHCIDYPNELLDVITMEPLIEPFELPDSKNIVNKSTIELHLYNSNTDPFTRKEITMEALESYNQQLEVLARVNEVKAKIDQLSSNFNKN